MEEDTADSDEPVAQEAYGKDAWMSLGVAVSDTLVGEVHEHSIRDCVDGLSRVVGQIVVLDLVSHLVSHATA